MAANLETYRIETEAEARGAREVMLRNLAGDVGMLRRDVQRLTWIAVPVSLVALTVAIVALVIALLLASLLAPVRPPASFSAPLPLRSAPLATSPQRRAAPSLEV